MNKEEDSITDAQVEALFEPSRLGVKLKEAEKQFKGLSLEQWHTLRALAKRDLFFLNHTVLGYNRFSPRLHGHLCRWIEETDDCRFRIVLLPRNHFKTRCVTIGKSIQLVLPYTETDRQHDPLGNISLSHPADLGPNARICICHESQSGSARYLYSITSHFTSNPMLMALFPECVPNNKKQRINKNELELPHELIFDEPTFDTMGVGVRSQGRHYNYIFLDDIYGTEARDSDAVDKSTKDWFDNIQAFFTEFTKDKWIMPGTRYRFDDIYNHAQENYGNDVKIYRRSVVETNTKTGEKEPIFPEEVTVKSLEIIKKNTKVYESQYMNDPSQSGSGFEADWERFFYWRNRKQIVIFDDFERNSSYLGHQVQKEIITDVSKNKTAKRDGDNIIPLSGDWNIQEGKNQRQQTLVNVDDLDICILIDPGEVTGGFIVTGTDYKFRIMTLVALPINMKPPALVELIFRSVVRWQPRTVSMEGDALQNVYQYWLLREMNIRGIRFHITDFRTSQKSKEDRILGLSNYYAAGRLFHNETQEELRREYKQFGVTKNIHLLDALAQGPEIWRPGWAPGQKQRMYEGDNTEEAASNRDLDTGYSAII